MKCRFAFAAVGLVALTLGACQTNPASPLAQSDALDRQFLDQMSEHHAGAIAMAQLAQQKGSTDHVKGMGKTLVSKEQPELQQLQDWRAQWYGTGQPPAPGEKDRQSLEDLAKLNGINFDRAYANKIIEHHQQEIASATPALTQAAHPEIRAFAQKLIDDQNHEIDHLKEHLREWSGQ